MRKVAQQGGLQCRVGQLDVGWCTCGGGLIASHNQVLRLAMAQSLTHPLVVGVHQCAQQVLRGNTACGAFNPGREDILR